MRKNFLIIFILTITISTNLLFIHFNYLNNDQSNKIAGISNIKNETVNSLFIGEFQFSLYGYTSPKALVSLSGQGIADQTTADKEGYFEFKNRYLPFSPNEACLIAQDQFGRTSLPTCLPPFPKNTNNITIGPVILPPTLSLNKTQYYIGDQVILTGQTIPNTQVTLSMFTQPTLLTKLTNKFFPSAYAFSLPKIEINSDSLGNFSISLPSNQAQNFRLFTQAIYEEKSSPQSVFLTLKIYPIWMIIIQFFLFIFNLIRPRLLEIIIVIEFFILIFYLKKTVFHPYYLKTRAIILRRNLAIIKKKKLSLIKAINKKLDGPPALTRYHQPLS